MPPLPATMLCLSLFSFLRCKPALSPGGPLESTVDRDAAFTEYPDALYPVRVKGKWGYMNRKAVIVIAPAWDVADDFLDGIAVVGRTIDGELRYGYINPKGEALIVPQFERAETFSEGLAAVSREGRFGYIDPSGREVIPAQYEAAGPFHEGFAGVKIDGWTAVIDKTGRVLETPKLTIAVDAIEYVDGLTRAFGADEQTGFLDTTGRWVIEPRFHSAGRFSEGLAWAMVQENDASAEQGFTIRGGYIDPSGRFVIEPAYDFGWDFTEGHAVVWARSADKQHKTWSVIDKTGKVVLGGLTYRNLGALHQGLIAIQDEEMNWGFMDLSGNVLIPPQYAGIDLFRNGLARMEVGDAFSNTIVYINPKGEIVWAE